MIRGAEGKRREAIEEIMEILGVKIDIKEIKGLGNYIKTRRETLLVRLENGEQRREIWKKKSALKGRRERILKDWTWEGGEKDEMEIRGDCKGKRKKR